METYCLSTAKVYDFNQWKQEEIVIFEKKFLLKRQLINRGTFETEDWSNYWIAPGKVYVDIEKPIFNSNMMDSQVRAYLYKGCSLLLAQFPVTSLVQMKKEFNNFKKSLETLALDYSIVPRIKSYLLKPSVIHYFAREKLPFILLEVNDLKELYKVKWEWINHAQGPRKIPIIPIENHKIPSLFKVWKKIADNFDLSTLPELISTLPLSKESLRITGISPTKGEIIQQGDADYLLFELDKNALIEQPDQLFYHKSIPSIAVIRGQTVRENHILKAERGFGQFISTTIPRHFTV